MISYPNELMKFDVAGPTWFRQPVQFKNWDAPGLAIAGEKLIEDGSLFRDAARQLRTMSTDNWALINAGALEAMASQYERAAKGETAQAK